MTPTPNTEAVTSASSASNTLSAVGELNASQPFTRLLLPDGREITLPTSLLMDRELNFSVGEVPSTSSDGPDTIVIPLIEERLEVGKRTVPIGKVRLRKTVQEFDAMLDEPLAVFTYDIERIVLNQPVELRPGVRTEGDTTVYPLVEEQLILTKQLILKEEVRVTRRQTERRDTQVVTLHREHLEVEREPQA